MDTVICGSTAFQYWRIPPVVQLLTVGPEDDPTLCRLLEPNKLLALRAELASTLPLSVTCGEPKLQRRTCVDSRRIRELHALLAPGCKLPVEVLTNDASRFHKSPLVRVRIWTHDLPFGSLVQIANDVCVTSPAFTMLQLAGHFDVARTVLLASELCGSFAVYKTPAPIARVLQDLIDHDRLPTLGGWEPSLRDGKLTDLWMRPPLLEPADLRQIAAVSESRFGRSTLERAAQLVVPGAASPFEVQAAVLLGFPRRLGGEGFSGLQHNARVPFSPEARLLAGKSCCYCDLWWDDGVDVECQSAQHHSKLGNYLSDSERTAALKAMGIEVIPITFAQLKHEKSYAALVKLIAGARGIRLRTKTERELAHAEKLRQLVFSYWPDLPG